MRKRDLRASLLRCFLICCLMIFTGQWAAAETYQFTTIAGLAGNSGSVDDTNSATRFFYPEGVAVDSAGTLYVSDTFNFTIRKLTPVGTNFVAATIAGLAENSGGGDGTNDVARFNYPYGIAVDTAGNLFVADTFNHTIRKLTPVGTNWVVTTIAGLAGNIGSADDTNSAARFYNPYGVAVDKTGNVYVGDRSNQTIRKLTPVGTNWVVTTIAGTAGMSGSADGTNGAASFVNPQGVALDSAGNLYVADTYNDTIRKVTPVGTNWVVTTIAGVARSAGSTDGTNDTALFNSPHTVAVDTSDNLYVGDTYNHTIRKLTASGTNWVVTTIGGLAGSSGSADDTNSAARFYFPEGVAAGGGGKIYIADTANDTIRIGQPVQTVSQPPPLLQIAFDGSQVTLSWPASASNFVLEAATELSTEAVWTTVSGATVSGDSYVLTLNATAATAFFRLRQTP